MAIVLTGCAADVDELRVTIDGVTVTAEQATSVEAQRAGLSGRDSVPEGTGMWFPLAPAQCTEVWMQDTRVSLDVVWIRDGRVTGVVTLQPCSTEPCPRESSPGAVDAILEAPAGTFSQTVVGATVERRSTDG
ncbi:DUF192 domain-containing protein [uncultured Pseudokineococcus sp.]|uniref:DUF192 domain-containing protein n=1 Tax=uncultured Pseudokineococcus sp. TaxID=1642928 RepID=UPI0026300A30|nr:DUF192 domain-containing protein [uncultured Pseudokineococcus sp.]